MPPTSFRTARIALTVPAIAGLGRETDAQLVALQREVSAVRRRLDAVTVAITAEVARRSDRSRGQDGLAARLGASTVEQAVQQLTETSRAEAKALTTVAMALGCDWLAPVGTSLTEGELSVAAAAAIAGGLGSPSDDVPRHVLHEVATTLVARAPRETPEALGRAARQAREELEVERIADLEAHRRSRRSLTWFAQADGMTRMVGVLDPESAAIVTTAIDTVLAPRRGGPRFIDAESAPDDSAALAADGRSTEQLAVDTLVDIVQLAVRASGSDLDPSHLFGVRTPAVRVHVTVDALVTGVGSASFEGQDAAVGADTAARHVCTSGILPVLFRGGIAIDAGRTHRLHTPRQRVALAAQWGGCAWTGCTRPPSMTEVHHIRAWNGANTTLDNGIPLCRFHHLQLYNTGWRIETGPPCEGARHWLVPPAGHPRERARIPLRPRHPRPQERERAGERAVR